MADNTDPRELEDLNEAINIFKNESALKTASSPDSPIPSPVAIFTLKSDRVYIWKQTKTQNQEDKFELDYIFHPDRDFDSTANNIPNTLAKTRTRECNFCKKNKEPASFYLSHNLKDNQGRVECPVLRAHRCEFCGVTGDYAHTKQYCIINAKRRSITKTPTMKMSNGKPRKFL